MVQENWDTSWKRAAVFDQDVTKVGIKLVGWCTGKVGNVVGGTAGKVMATRNSVLIKTP